MVRALSACLLTPAPPRFCECFLLLRYDTSLANWEALYGIIGGAADLNRDRVADAPAAAIEEDTPNDAPRLPPKRKESRAAVLTLARSTTLFNLASRLDARIAPGTTLGPPSRGVMAPYAAQALVVSRLHPSLPLPSAVRIRPRGQVNPHIPAPIDYGAIAAAGAYDDTHTARSFITAHAKHHSVFPYAPHFRQ
jgi:hypothetical protein